MESTPPNVVILAGPNGAGKSTLSRALLESTLGLRHFVNADTLGRGLSEFHPEDMALKAGKIMLQHLHDLAAARASFAFETTLASRTFAPWIKELKATGYACHLFFLWLPAADVSIQRVRDRVAHGGHHVPAETIQRRYQRGLHNFFHLYEPLADFWKFYNNAEKESPLLIAEKDGKMLKVHDAALWRAIQGEQQP
jgi:predicted ABC-type ATPase